MQFKHAVLVAGCLVIFTGAACQAHVAPRSLRRRKTYPTARRCPSDPLISQLPAHSLPNPKYFQQRLNKRQLLHKLWCQTRQLARCLPPNRASHQLLRPESKPYTPDHPYLHHPARPGARTLQLPLWAGSPLSLQIWAGGRQQPGNHRAQ